MSYVRPKKFLGQHFLKDEVLALTIVNSLTGWGSYEDVLEIGPGMGVLTQFLIEKKTYQSIVIELDRESVAYLQRKFPDLKIINGDFLKEEITIKSPFAVIGNFPYNISTQILFKVLEMRDSVPEVVGMFQKEVAQRIASPPGNKTYGIMSVLLQAFYDIEYLFTVEPEVFDPPPRVKSAVIRLKRNSVKVLDCDEKIFVRVVKQGFQNRRKTLRNALKPLNLPEQAC